MAAQTERVRASRRMRRLVAKRDDLILATVQRDERNKELSARREAKLSRQMLREKERYNARLVRQAKSKLYARAPWLYVLLAPLFALGRGIRGLWRKAAGRARDFRGRRPHRTFYLTDPGQSRRRIKMRGYFGFLGEVWRFIWDNKRLFLKFLGLYAVISVLILGISQDTFNSFKSALDEVGFDEWSRWPALMAQAIFGGNGSTDSGQKIASILILIYGFLILIWLVREITNGNKQVKLRDGLYSGGAPVLALAVLAMLLVVQVIPLGIALFAYQSMASVGVINSGIAIENMAAWCALAVIIVLTLYWMMGTVMAMIIVTIPGVYPFRAYSRAGDLIVGRRMQILMRVVVMLLPLVLLWLVVLLPMIMLDSAINVDWLPLIPATVLLLSTLSIIWIAVYLYLLYRHIIDDPTPLPNQLPKSGHRWIWRRIRDLRHGGRSRRSTSAVLNKETPKPAIVKKSGKA